MSETIIIIDDSRIVTRVLKDILKGEYQVLIAANGQDGIDLARKEKASLVLMGVDMPGEDGYHICGRMKQDPDLKNIPVIFITARESEEDEERGLAVGAIDYLTKPVSPPIVKARVRSHLELKRQRDSLADLSEMKTRLFSILAHDLKNPFTTLLGLTDIMMEMGSELSREEMLDFGRRLNDSSRRVFSLLENLLEWLRLQMGGVAPDLKPVNLAELAHRTLDLMTLPAQEKGVRLISRVPEDLKVMADENMTDTVIRNLAGNALKFTP
ncbi:MAG: hybrid sensor histidine kinase/response regulator, partial [Deltaproteobacteria bacterium]|nr:hybrid sensor histidine kinase/response regulator [Deltaproteobacteria bacterium]